MGILEAIKKLLTQDSLLLERGESLRTHLWARFVEEFGAPVSTLDCEGCPTCRRVPDHTVAIYLSIVRNHGQGDDQVGLMACVLRSLDGSLREQDLLLSIAKEVVGRSLPDVITANETLFERVRDESAQRRTQN